MENQKILDTILGVAIGDTLGLSVQFITRNPAQRLTEERVMFLANHIGNIYSDDTAMTLCTLDSFIQKDWQLDEKDLMDRFILWINEGYMTCTKKAIDIGMATQKALMNYYNGAPLELCGCRSFYECGNGSLMRISPTVFYFFKHPEADKLETARKISSLTHAHDICILSCYIYLEILLEILNNPMYDKIESVRKAIQRAKITADENFSDEVLKLFGRIFDFDNLIKLDVDDIKSSCYVLDSLEAAIWCFTTTDNYKDCIIKAIRLGGDTDSIAAIAGGIAGLYYGYTGIPKEWRTLIHSKGLDNIYTLFDRLSKK